MSESAIVENTTAKTDWVPGDPIYEPYDIGLYASDPDIDTTFIRCLLQFMDDHPDDDCNRCPITATVPLGGMRWAPKVLKYEYPWCIWCGLDDDHGLVCPERE